MRQPGVPGRITAVALDVGSTLVKDDRYWAGWADWLGVPRHTLSALIGAMLALGREDRDALRLLRPGIDVEGERAVREAAGHGEQLDEDDLYPDARPALAALRAAGLRVVVAGNQSARAGELLRALDLPADVVATSEEWGVAKPEPAFFAKVVEAARAQPHQVLYVGDIPAGDVTPAAAAGLRTAHLRRGPWGHLWSDTPACAAADWHLTSLHDLPSLLAEA